MPRQNAHKKTRLEQVRRVCLGGACAPVQAELLQLDFLVLDMLACFRIKFHDQHLVRSGLLVFGGRVEVTGAGS